MTASLLVKVLSVPCHYIILELGLSAEGRIISIWLSALVFGQWIFGPSRVLF